MGSEVGPLHPLFVNENLGGHATVHVNLRRALERYPDVAPVFFDAAPLRLLRKVFSHSIPGLAELDLDFQSLRFQVAQSLVARRHVKRLAADCDVVHAYSHTIAGMFPDVLAARPSLVAVDGTNRQLMQLRPNRRASVGTPLTFAATKPLEQRILKAATFVVAQSKWAADDVADLGVHRERVRIVRYGVPVPDTVPERRREDVPVITFVGRGLERKGGLLLLDVFRRRFRGRAILHLVTPDAVEPEDGVIVHDNIRPGDGKVQDLLSSTDIFALPTDMDMAPNAVIEAMAAGAAVVSTQHAAIPEMVANGESGLLVPTNDGKALAAALEDLIDNRAKADAMGLVGFQRAREHFDVTKTTPQLIDLMREAKEAHAAHTASRRTTT